VLLAQAKAYISIEQPEVCILLARLEGRVAGFANLRIEPHGVAYLCDALTAADARNRGVYLSLVAHRLSLARDQGCRIALIQAIRTSSAPILLKRGFREVCQIRGYRRP
jgi:hypothetical protein